MNDGKKLEALVREFEELLLPEGFTVEANVKEKEDGLTIGEFDLLISGRVGSLPVRYLIECRDRPTAGPQGRDWIQQLVGRKFDFKFDGVVAVSTTGFTEPARQFAIRERVFLRTVRRAADIVGVLKPIAFNYPSLTLRPEGPVEIFYVPGPLPIPDSAAVLRGDDLRLRVAGGGTFMSLSDFVWEKFPRYVDRAPEGQQRFHFRHNGHLEISVKGKVKAANSIAAPMCYERRSIKGTVIAVSDYEGETQLLAQEFEVRFSHRDGDISYSFAVSLDGEAAQLRLLKMNMPPSMQADFEKAGGGGIYVIPEAGEQIKPAVFSVDANGLPRGARRRG